VQFELPPLHVANVRRYMTAALIGLAIALVAYLWVLWDHGLDPLRTAWSNGAASNFYDLQARALFHGDWHVPRGTLSIEAFVVDGREYMYFGPFPALLRMPILAITDSFDGQLTALSMLLAWLVTALFSSLLVWRIRVLVRGPVALGRAEAASYAVFLATITSGSALLHLAAMPWVYNEDFAWGAALGIGTLFAVIGVLEKPTAGRVLGVGALALAATLSRTTIGWGCVIAVLLTAIWFGLGRGGNENRRWCPALLVVGMTVFSIGCAVNWVKFGIPFGVDMGSQIFTKVNHHRREVLAANGGRLWSPTFVPSTAWAYLRPNGVHFTSVYPFVTLPTSPAEELGGVTLDQTYRAGSIPATMPLLFLLGLWGVVAAFRRRANGVLRLMRLPLIAAAMATTGVLVWGYIAHRYIAEFIPLLVVAGALGMVDLWRRFEGKSQRVGLALFVSIVTVGGFSVLANLGLSSSPTDATAWRGHRVRDFVEMQKQISDFTGHPLNGKIARGGRLPKWAPADQLFVLDDCSGLYLSTGERESPTWVTVELGPGFRHAFDVTYHDKDQGRIPLVTIGDNRTTVVSMEDRGIDWIRWIRFRVDGPSHSSVGRWSRLTLGETLRVDVVTDVASRRASVAVAGKHGVDGSIVSDSPVRLQTRPGSQEPRQLVTIVEKPVPVPRLCRELTR
jgi:hypothetical protein